MKKVKETFLQMWSLKLDHYYPNKSVGNLPNDAEIPRSLAIIALYPHLPSEDITLIYTAMKSQIKKISRGVATAYDYNITLVPPMPSFFYYSKNSPPPTTTLETPRD
jgi:hypothetical protein